MEEEEEEVEAMGAEEEAADERKRVWEGRPRADTADLQRLNMSGVCFETRERSTSRSRGK